MLQFYDLVNEVDWCEAKVCLQKGCQKAKHAKEFAVLIPCFGLKLIQNLDFTKNSVYQFRAKKTF